MPGLHQHYRRAPITEAALDFRVAQSQGFHVSRIEHLSNLLRERYPRQTPVVASALSITLGTQMPNPQVVSTPQGYQMRTEDDHRILGALEAGFTFSQLRPYDTWETFRDEAHDLWNMYKESCGTATVSRVGLRYINRIDIPNMPVDPAEFLNVYPGVSRSLAPEPAFGKGDGFFLQLQRAQPDITSSMIINVGRVDSQKEHVFSVILDIDLFREESDSPWDAKKDTDVWDLLEKMRVRKNEVFEASITEATRKLIE